MVVVLLREWKGVYNNSIIENVNGKSSYSWFVQLSWFNVMVVMIKRRIYNLEKIDGWMDGWWNSKKWNQMETWSVCIDDFCCFDCGWASLL